MTLPKTEGLAFVASAMRSPMVGPVAALKSLGRVRSPTPTTAADGPIVLNAGAIRNEEVESSKSVLNSYEFGKDDDSVRAMRSEMVDLVYQRSLDRLDSFNNK